MGTRKDVNSEIDEDAVHVVEGILRGEDWNHSKPQPDKVGLDMRVICWRIVTPRSAFTFRSKGWVPKTTRGERQPLISKSGTISKAIELEHLDYYMKLPVPVFLVVVDVVEKVAYYVHVHAMSLKNSKVMIGRRGFAVTMKGEDDQDGTNEDDPCSRQAILSDTSTFKDVIRDAKGYMESLPVEPGMKYQEAALTRLDERFRVTYIRDREGGHFQIDAKEPVEMKLHAKLPKKKFDEMFGRGVRVCLDAGEVRIDGSPLWEKIASETKEIHIKQQRKGFINILRLNESGQQIARIEHLRAQIEGGLDEWRYKFHLPNNLFGIEFNLDVGAIRQIPRHGCT